MEQNQVIPYGGRPRGRARRYPLSVSLNETQHDEIQRAVRLSGEAVSVFLRTAATQRAVQILQDQPAIRAA